MNYKTLLNIALIFSISLISTTTYGFGNSPKNNAKAVDKATFYMKEGNYLKAISLFKQTLLANQNNAQFHHDLGYSYHKIKVYDKALRHYKTDLEVNGKHEQANKNIGSLYFELGNKQ